MFPRSLFLVIAAVICSCVIAPVQQARVFGESDKSAIRNRYDHCLLASIRKDYAALRESFQAPFVVLAGGNMRVFTSIDSVMAFYRKQLRSCRNYQYADHPTYAG